MKNLRTLCVVLGLTLVTGCTTTPEIEPSTNAHLSCEKLRALYSPDIDDKEFAKRLESVGINIATLHDQVRTEIAYQRSLGTLPDAADAEANTDDKKPESDVRAAYTANGC